MKKTESRLDRQMWKEYEVVLFFQKSDETTGRLCGSVPLNKELVKVWLESRAPEKQPDNSKTLAELEEEVIATIDDIQEKVTLGFQKDEKGLFVRGSSLRAHLKDCANQLRELLDVTGFRAKVANKLYVKEERIYLNKDKHDGSEDKTIHADTPRGRISALKTVQFVNEPRLVFHLRILNDGVLSKELLMKIFDYGSVHGFGQERSMGEGKYIVEKFEEVA